MSLTNEQIYEGELAAMRARLATAENAWKFNEAEVKRLRAKAVPIDQWKSVVDEPVLIYVVHDNAQYEPDEKRRKAEWESWCVGRWIKHNKGGWMWHGLCGRVTHVAPLPAVPVSSSPPTTEKT